MTIGGKIYSIGNYAGDVLNRVIEVPIAVGHVAGVAGETVTGVLGTAASILCGGKVDKFNQTAELTKEAGFILPLLFRRIAHIVNKTSDAVPMKKKAYRDKPYYSAATKVKDGPCREHADLFERAHRLASDGTFVMKDGQLVKEGSVIKNHLLSRITYLGAGLVAIVARVIDAVIGLFLGLAALVFSLFVRKVNPDAFIMIDQCLSFNVVDDVCRAVRGFVNPHQTRLVGKNAETNVKEYLKKKQNDAALKENLAFKEQDRVQQLYDNNVSSSSTCSSSNPNELNMKDLVDDEVFV